MTRRIGVAILLTVWATLVAGGVTAYLTTRMVLLADLDHSLVARASALPEIVDDAGRSFTPAASVLEGDRYIVRSETGRTVARPTTRPLAQPRLMRAAFARLPDGTRVRSVTLRTMGRPIEGGEPVPVTVTFSGSAERFDSLLTRLGIALTLVGALGGVLAALIARVVADRALRPLRATADVVGAIDERTLHRRIDEAQLPAELRPVATRLNEMLARLEDSLRRRQQFMADASHELRTPVAALVTAVEVALRRQRDPQAYRQTLETCLADAQLLRNLVESLLTQVRSELAEANDHAEVVDLPAVIRECVTVVSPLAESRGIRLCVDVPPAARINTQPARVRSILLNLLGNAIEHSHDHGEVVVSARYDGSDAEIEVRDQGKGIAADHLARIFEPFYRVDAARESGHLGLGLYLVQTHVRCLNGSISVKSSLGSGTMFLVRLSANEPSDFRAAAAPAEESS